MPGHEPSPQGSFEIDPDQGAFVVPEAPIDNAQTGKFDADAAEEARIAHLVSQGAREYDPNQRRATQTEGVGGGISEAVDGTLHNDLANAPTDNRVLKVGSFFNGAPIRSDADLQRALATQEAQRIQTGRRSISHLDDTQRDRVDRGIAQARAAIAAVPREPRATKPRGIDEDFDSTIFDQVVPEGREIPNRSSRPKPRPTEEHRTTPYVQPPAPPRSPANDARRQLYRGPERPA